MSQYDHLDGEIVEYQNRLLAIGGERSKPKPSKQNLEQNEGRQPINDGENNDGPDDDRGYDGMRQDYGPHFTSIESIINNVWTSGVGNNSVIPSQHVNGKLIQFSTLAVEDDLYIFGCIFK